uniref:Uncharacterized protein n=1 Tax=Hucho hucho TaxID=62062 RepID=A0A4W5R0C3_9TELE
MVTLCLFLPLSLPPPFSPSLSLPPPLPLILFIRHWSLSDCVGIRSPLSRHPTSGNALCSEPLTSPGTSWAICPIEFPVILRDALEVLSLNDNQLEVVPQSVCGLRNLMELYLSNNPGIRELPAELGQLSNLWQLDIEDLNITNVPQDIR